MDLDPKVAELGFKYHTDRAHDPLHQLSNADQLAEAFERGCRLLKRGQGRDVVLEIHNLVSFFCLYAVMLRRTDGFTSANQAKWHYRSLDAARMK